MISPTRKEYTIVSIGSLQVNENHAVSSKPLIHYPLSIILKPMKQSLYTTQDRIAALATPFASSALAVIRTSGAGSIEAVARCSGHPDTLLSAGHSRMVHMELIHPEDGHPIDDVVMGVFRAPGGYTGEDSIEIYCHGSLPGIQAILSALKFAGFRDAQRGEFTLRAFLNGRMDLTRAEAVQEIVGAKSEKAHEFALNRLSGGLYQRIEDEKRILTDMMSILEVQLDYAEDELPDEIPFPADQVRGVLKRLSDLAATYAAGRLYHEGARIALAGRTNAGKSSLFNLFLKEDRAIVSEIHGTTRDYLESWISIAGLPARLFDTAGFRDIGLSHDADLIEQEGIRRSRELVSSSDIVLYLFDGVAGMSGPEEQLFSDHRDDERYLFLWNKADHDACRPSPEGVWPVSAVSASGFHSLEQEILRRLTGKTPGIAEDQVMIDSQRQKELLDRAVEALGVVIEAHDGGMPLDVLAAELQEVLFALGSLTGEVTSDDILDRIFSGFCVGK